MISYRIRSPLIEIGGNASASRSETPHGDHSCDDFYVAAFSYLHEINPAVNTCHVRKTKYATGVSTDLLMLMPSISLI
jgi:hypothetical protein